MNERNFHLRHPSKEQEKRKEMFIKYPWLKKWLLGVLMSASLSLAGHEGRDSDEKTAKAPENVSSDISDAELVSEENYEAFSNEEDNASWNMAQEDLQPEPEIEGLVKTDREQKSLEFEKLLEKAEKDLFKGRFHNNPKAREKFFEVLETDKNLRAMIEKSARENDLDPNLIWATIATESSFKKRQVSPRGAVGYMQIMAPSARDVGFKVGPEKDERLIPEKNIEAGSRLLKKYKERFILDSLALVAYNEGPGRLAKRISSAFPQIVVGRKYGGFVDKELYRSLVENGTINFVDMYNFAEKHKNSQKYKEALDYALNVEVFYRQIAEIEAGRGEPVRIVRAEDDEKDYKLD